ncbi:uncharacterized protein LOC144315421 [Canis aureus]
MATLLLIKNVVIIFEYVWMNDFTITKTGTTCTPIRCSDTTLIKCLIAHTLYKPDLVCILFVQISCLTDLNLSPQLPMQLSMCETSCKVSDREKKGDQHTSPQNQEILMPQRQESHQSHCSPHSTI